MVPEGTAGAAFPKVRMQFEGNYGGGEDQRCFLTTPPRYVAFEDPWDPIDILFDFPVTEIVDEDWDQDAYPDYFVPAPELEADKEGQLRYWFFTFTRETDVDFGFTPCNMPVTSWLALHSSLTYFRPLDLKVYAGQDDDPDAQDNMRIYTGFDEAGMAPNPPADRSVELAFDDEDATNLSGYGLLQGYYVDHVFVNFWEMDEEVLLQYWDPYSPSWSGVPTLSGFEPGDVMPYVFADGGAPDSADYYYVLYVGRCYGDNDPTCWAGLP